MFLVARSVIAARGPLCGPAIAILGYASGGAVEERLPQRLAMSENGIAMDSQMRVLLNSIDTGVDRHDTGI
jgi:hypothetical protein